MADSGATGNRDFEDTGENDEALTSKIHEQPHIYSTEQNSAPMHAPKRIRISMNDLLMSKICSPRSHRSQEQHKRNVCVDLIKIS